MPDPNNPHADKNRELTLEQFDNMPGEEMWKRAILIEDKDEFIRKNKRKGGDS